MERGGLLFVVGVALGSVVGATMALVLTDTRPHESQSAPAPRQDVERLGPVFEKALARALSRIERERVSNAARPEEAEVAQSPTVGSPEVSEPHVPALRARDSYTQDRDAPLGPKNVARVNALIVRSADAATRRRQEWLFQSESAVARTLGVPDGVSPDKDQGYETWRYEIPFVNSLGEQDTHSVRFYLSRGRVIEVDGAEEIPDK